MSANSGGTCLRKRLPDLTWLRSPRSCPVLTRPFVTLISLAPPTSHDRSVNREPARLSGRFTGQPCRILGQVLLILQIQLIQRARLGTALWAPTQPHQVA